MHARKIPSFVLLPGILGDARTDVSFQSTRVQVLTGLVFRV